MTVRTLLNGVEVSDYPDLPEEARRGKDLRVTGVGEEVPHAPRRRITAFGTEEVGTLIADMFATMAIAEGVGLAANQVGVDLRLFVYDLTEDGVRHVGHVFNPTCTIDREEGNVEGEEGCLSVPGPGAGLFRANRALLTGVD